MTDDKSELQSLRQQACLGGGARRIEAQHAKGKATARERIEKLLDPGTFNEIGMFITHRASGFDLRPVPLAAQERLDYYQGFANESIWPRFHDIPSRCRFLPSCRNITEH